MTRPLSFAKVEATGKSYSDHEALEVDLELSNSNKKSDRESKRKVIVSKNTNKKDNRIVLKNTPKILLSYLKGYYRLNSNSHILNSKMCESESEFNR